jgi:hypothetical protein
LWIVRSYQATYISASIKDVMVNTPFSYLEITCLSSFE